MRDFKEWIDELYGTIVDLCDLSEDVVAELYEVYKEEEK